MNNAGIKIIGAHVVRAVLFIAAVLTAVCLLLFIPVLNASNSSKAYADTTDTLEVYVGYAGGPYYLKHTFTYDELAAMSKTYEYSALNSGQFLVKYKTSGVALEDLFAAAIDDTTGTSVNTDQVWRLAFETEDNYKPDDGGYGNTAWYWDYYKDIATTDVLNTAKTPRYYYSNLAEYFDFSSKEIYPGYESKVKESAVAVPSMIALDYYKNTITSITDWTDVDSADMSFGSYRLVYGQTSPTDVGMGDQVHSIKAIYCIYQGKPSVTVDQTDIKGYIGDTVDLSATIESADALIDQLGAANIDWSTLDTDIVNIYDNKDGTVTLFFKGNGDASISLSYGESPYSEFLSSGSATASGPGGTNWREEGEGTKWKYEGNGPGGSGTGSGGTGDSSGGAGTAGGVATPGSDSSSGAEGGSAVDAVNNAQVGGEGEAGQTLKDLGGTAQQVSIGAAETEPETTSAAADVQPQASDVSSVSTSTGGVNMMEVLAYQLHMTDQSVDDAITDEVQLPWAAIVVICAIILVGGLLQGLYFFKSLDRRAVA